MPWLRRCKRRITAPLEALLQASVAPVPRPSPVPAPLCLYPQHQPRPRLPWQAGRVLACPAPLQRCCAAAWSHAARLGPPHAPCALQHRHLASDRLPRQASGAVCLLAPLCAPVAFRVAPGPSSQRAEVVSPHADECRTVARLSHLQSRKQPGSAEQMALALALALARAWALDRNVSVAQRGSGES